MGVTNIHVILPSLCKMRSKFHALSARVLCPVNFHLGQKPKKKKKIPFLNYLPSSETYTWNRKHTRVKKLGTYLLSPVKQFIFLHGFQSQISYKALLTFQLFWKNNKKFDSEHVLLTECWPLTSGGYLLQVLMPMS